MFLFFFNFFFESLSLRPNRHIRTMNQNIGVGHKTEPIPNLKIILYQNL